MGELNRKILEELHFRPRNQLAQKSFCKNKVSMFCNAVPRADVGNEECGRILDWRVT